MGRGLAAGQRRLGRGTPRRLCLGGAVVTLAVAGAAAAAAWGLAQLGARLGPPGLLIEALALKAVLSVRGLAVAAGQVARHLAGGDLASARTAAGVHLVSRPTAPLDGAHVASAAIESVAENLTDSVLAPLLFYAILGLPGAAAYRAVNTADAMFGYRAGDLEHFGRVPARLDDLLNLGPARVAGLLLVAAAAPAGCDARRAWFVMRRDHARTASPNAGWTMAAMAGALGVRLRKPGHYVLGEGNFPAPADVPRSLRIFGWAVLGSAMVAAIVARIISSL
jgi:adenosylcobinamide-phosphate synthase